MNERTRTRRIKAYKNYFEAYVSDIEEEIQYSDEHFPDGPVPNYAQLAKQHRKEQRRTRGKVTNLS